MSESVIRKAGGVWVVINDEGERDYFPTLEAAIAADPRALVDD